MADEDQRLAAFPQGRLQPGDCRNVEVVGGLVEEQHVGVGRKGVGEGGAALLAAGHGAGGCVWVELKRLQRHDAGVGVVALGKPGGDVFADSGER